MTVSISHNLVNTIPNLYEVKGNFPQKKAFLFKQYEIEDKKYDIQNS